MKKNVASQVVSAVVVSATDGSAVTASVAVTVTGDAGTQGAGGGTLVHEGGGEWSYVPTQAETNFDHILFKFSATGAVPVGIQVYTTFPQTGDSFAKTTNLPADPADASDIAAAFAALNDLSQAEAQQAADDALVANHLDHLLKTTYDPASKPGAADALLNELVESDGGVSRYTANALEQAPAAPTAAAVADQVWEEAIADHSGTAGSTAEALNAAGASGDPWTTQLPGAYGAGSAGKIIGDNVNATISSRSSHAAADVWAVATRALTDKAGFSLSAAGVAAIWDALVSGITTADSIGKRIIDFLTGDIFARLGAPAGASHAADLAAIKAVVDAALADTNELQTDWVNGGRLDLLIDAIKAKTDGLPADPADASDIAAAIAALNDLSAAEVNAEVVDALATDTYAEPTGVPAATATLAAKINRMYQVLIAGIDVTASKKQFKNAAGTVIWEKDLSDDATTYSETAGNAP